MILFLVPPIPPPHPRLSKQKRISSSKKRKPTRCGYCHTNLNNLVAQCLICDGAMHISCADEFGGICFTPGCSST